MLGSLDSEMTCLGIVLYIGEQDLMIDSRSLNRSVRNSLGAVQDLLLCKTGKLANVESLGRYKVQLPPKNDEEEVEGVKKN